YWFMLSPIFPKEDCRLAGSAANPLALVDFEPPPPRNLLIIQILHKNDFSRIAIRRPYPSPFLTANRHNLSASKSARDLLHGLIHGVFPFPYVVSGHIIHIQHIARVPNDSHGLIAP